MSLQATPQATPIISLEKVADPIGQSEPDDQQKKWVQSEVVCLNRQHEQTTLELQKSNYEQGRLLAMYSQEHAARTQQANTTTPQTFIALLNPQPIDLPDAPPTATEQTTQEKVPKETIAPVDNVPREDVWFTNGDPWAAGRDNTSITLLTNNTVVEAMEVYADHIRDVEG